MHCNVAYCAAKRAVCRLVSIYAVHGWSQLKLIHGAAERVAQSVSIRTHVVPTAGALKCKSQSLLLAWGHSAQAVLGIGIRLQSDRALHAHIQNQAEGSGVERPRTTHRLNTQAQKKAR